MIKRGNYRNRRLSYTSKSITSSLSFLHYGPFVDSMGSLARHSSINQSINIFIEDERDGQITAPGGYDLLSGTNKEFLKDTLEF